MEHRAKARAHSGVDYKEKNQNNTQKTKQNPQLPKP